MDVLFIIAIIFAVICFLSVATVVVGVVTLSENVSMVAFAVAIGSFCIAIGCAIGGAVIADNEPKNK